MQHIVAFPCQHFPYLILDSGGFTQAIQGRHCCIFTLQRLRERATMCMSKYIACLLF